MIITCIRFKIASPNLFCGCVIGCKVVGKIAGRANIISLHSTSYVSKQANNNDALLHDIFIHCSRDRCSKMISRSTTRENNHPPIRAPNIMSQSTISNKLSFHQCKYFATLLDSSSSNCSVCNTAYWVGCPSPTPPHNWQTNPF